LLAGLAKDDLLTHAIHRASHLTQRQLTQRGEILRREEVVQCGGDLVLAIDLPLDQTLPQVLS